VVEDLKPIDLQNLMIDHTLDLGDLKFSARLSTLNPVEIIVTAHYPTAMEDHTVNFGLPDDPKCTCGAATCAHVEAAKECIVRNWVYERARMPFTAYVGHPIPNEKVSSKKAKPT
jgi:hypothetical protein